MALSLSHGGGAVFIVNDHAEACQGYPQPQFNACEFINT
jgi:hypothetical protein